MTTSFSWPHALMRPQDDEKPPQRILYDPYDEPLPLDDRMPVTHPGYHKGRIPPNKGRRYPIEILTPREVSAVLEAFPIGHQYAGTRSRAMVAVMYRAGLRINEVLHLRSKDIDWENCTIRVLFGKGQRARTVGIDPGGLDFVAAWITERTGYGFPDDAPLFCSLGRGRLLNQGTFRVSLKIAAQRSGVTKRIHAHGFRHTFAFELAMEGVPLPIIQLQLGHAWATSTAAYIAHVAPADVIDRIRSRNWILQPSVRPGYVVGAEADRRLTSTPSALRLRLPSTPLALVSDTGPCALAVRRSP